MDKKEIDKNKRKWIVVLLVGVLALVAGSVGLMSDKNIADNYTGTAMAVVADYEEEEDYSSVLETLETVYVPVLTYTVDDKEYTERYSQNYSNKKYDIGESVKIKYDPDAPDQFSIAEDDRGRFIAMWEIPLGIALIAAGIYQLIKLKKITAS